MSCLRHFNFEYRHFFLWSWVGEGGSVTSSPLINYVHRDRKLPFWYFICKIYMKVNTVFWWEHSISYCVSVRFNELNYNIYPLKTFPIHFFQFYLDGSGFHLYKFESHALSFSPAWRTVSVFEIHTFLFLFTFLVKISHSTRECPC
jgi:hypothetical protein